MFCKGVLPLILLAPAIMPVSLAFSGPIDGSRRVPSQLIRLAAAEDTGDGSTLLLGDPSATEVSRVLFARPTKYPGSVTLSFLAHAMMELVRLDIVQVAPGNETLSVPCAEVDSGECTEVRFTRSEPGEIVDGARSHVNLQTPTLDLSLLYGATLDERESLRGEPGGRFNLDAETGLPPRDPATGAMLVINSLINTHPVIAGIAIVLMREHNRVAETVQRAHARLESVHVFDIARIVTTHRYRKMIVDRLVPALTGRRLPGAYSGFNPEVDPRASQLFAIAASRYGHSALPENTLRISKLGVLSEEGHLDMASSLFNTDPIYASHDSLDEILRGAAFSSLMRIDARMVRPMRTRANNIVDLSIVNILRGRDHNLPRYPAALRALGLPSPRSFNDLLPGGVMAGVISEENVAALQSLYSTIDDVDAWVAGVMERPVRATATVGGLFAAVIEDQVGRARAGDPAWEPVSFVALANEDPEVRWLVRGQIRDRTVSRLIEYASLHVEVGSIIRENTFVGTTFPAEVLMSRTNAPPPRPSYEDIHIQLLPTFTLSWRILSFGKSIEFTLRGLRTGFMAIGLGSQSMYFADIAFVTVSGFGSSLRANIIDGYLDDTELLAKDPMHPAGILNLIGVTATDIDSDTVAVTFSRPMIDPAIPTNRLRNRHDIVAEGTDIIGAIGTSRDADYHGPKGRVVTSINFFASSDIYSWQNLYDVQVVHGLGMVLHWGVLVPLGVYYVRFYKHRPSWITVHGVIQSLGTASALPLVISATSSFAKRAYTRHTVMGMVMFLILFGQLALGNVIHFKIFGANKGSKTFALRRLHRIIGWAVMIAAPFQISMGFNTLNTPQYLRVLYFIWVAIVVTLFALTAISTYKRDVTALRGREGNHVSNGDHDVRVGKSAKRRSSKHLEIIPPVGVSKLAMQGRRVVIVNGLVVDTERWIAGHPGGVELIRARLGMDVSEYFEGDDVAEMAHRHVHSSRARDLVAANAIGRYMALDAETTSRNGDRGTGSTFARLPEFSWADISNATESGAMWFVIEDLVIDVTTFLHAHPGGAHILLAYVGADATNVFNGFGTSAAHAHSDEARSVLVEHVLGRLSGLPSTVGLLLGAPGNDISSSHPARARRKHGSANTNDSTEKPITPPVARSQRAVQSLPTVADSLRIQRRRSSMIGIAFEFEGSIRSSSGTVSEVPSLVGATSGSLSLKDK